MSMALVRSIEGSNLPASEKKSLVRRMYDGVSSHVRNQPRSLMPLAARQGVESLRQGGESLAVGLVLGATHAMVGLDAKDKVPMDLVAAAVGYTVAIGMPHEEYATDARNVASACVTTFGVRQGYAFAAESKAKSGGTAKGFTPITKAFSMHGESKPDFGSEDGGDPILAIAKKL